MYYLFFKAFHAVEMGFSFKKKIKKGQCNVCNKRNQIITQAVLDVLGSNTGIYTADDVLTAANIDNDNLQELLKEFQNSVANIAKQKQK